MAQALYTGITSLLIHPINLDSFHMGLQREDGGVQCAGENYPIYSCSWMFLLINSVLEVYFSLLFL